jgi:predicted nucleotidyltransferase component of viral defense system
MSLPEMAAEKLRTLAQRSQPTDLADLAVILQYEEVSDEDIARLAVHKFKLVKSGVASRAVRIEERIKSMVADYDGVVPALFPDAPNYSEATQIVWPRIKPLIPK